AESFEDTCEWGSAHGLQAFRDIADDERLTSRCWRRTARGRRCTPDVIFVGTAAGRRSAAASVYYAHPGNYFWRTLWLVGLTPRRFAPHDFAKLRDVG